MRTAGARRMVWLAVTCLALAACGDEPAGIPADTTAEPGDRYTTTATVIEAPGHGPQLCTSVMESNPPQCGGGIEVVGWDWTGLDGSETAEDTTWGEYVVIGTYDGERFTITEPPTPYVAPEPTEPPPATTPCPPGALCVSSGERTAADLESLRARLHDELAPLGSSVDGRAGQVFMQVIVDDGLQAELDQRYGPGLVRVHALLTPVN
jgi:hypothetical protein